MPKYAAFLRGINSGKNPVVKMDFLKKIFEELGFKNVATIIASGNVVFDADFHNNLEEIIENAISSKLGFESPTIVKTREQLQKLVEQNPFKNEIQSKSIKFNVSFIKNINNENNSDLEGHGYKIVDIIDNCVFSLVDLGSAKTPDLMKVLEKEFGKDTTTRTWATVLKVINKMN